jgi:holo-[acyl-carrier protein] synthase
MKLETGIDLVEISRIGQAIQRLGPRFLNRIYTPDELAYCHGRLPQLAARFAAKEAVGKVLGTGLWRDGVNWQQIEVSNSAGGKPYLKLSGSAAEHAAILGLNQWSISLTHTETQAMAFVVATGE